MICGSRYSNFKLMGNIFLGVSILKTNEMNFWGWLTDLEFRLCWVCCGFFFGLVGRLLWFLCSDLWLRPIRLGCCFRSMADWFWLRVESSVLMQPIGYVWVDDSQFYGVFCRDCDALFLAWNRMGILDFMGLSFGKSDCVCVLLFSREADLRCVYVLIMMLFLVIIWGLISILFWRFEWK